MSYLKEKFIQRFFYRSVDVHSRFDVLTNQGLLLPHFDNQDLSPFFAALVLYIYCSWNKDRAEGLVKVMVQHWHRAQSFLSSWKGPETGRWFCQFHRGVL